MKVPLQTTLWWCTLKWTLNFQKCRFLDFSLSSKRANRIPKSKQLSEMTLMLTFDWGTRRVNQMPIVETKSLISSRIDDLEVERCTLRLKVWTSMDSGLETWLNFEYLKPRKFLLDVNDSYSPCEQLWMAYFECLWCLASRIIVPSTFTPLFSYVCEVTWENVLFAKPCLRFGCFVCFLSPKNSVLLKYLSTRL